MGKLFSIQEMTPNEHGIVGLNKPKKTEIVKVLNEKNEIVIKSIKFDLTDKFLFVLLAN
jgi:hypothetical protein